VPSDLKFRSAFCVKSLQSGIHARFILRELESQERGGKPEALSQPVDDPGILSLEHILPKNVGASDGWAHFSSDEHRAYRNRLGNLVLLNAKDNGAIGDKGFAEKRAAIERSSNIHLTKDVITRTESTGKWTKAEIEGRQGRLADLAILRWPMFPAAAR
jgi:hypothetical protein